jgi:hypothetical protein
MPTRTMLLVKLTSIVAPQAATPQLVLPRST